MLTNAGCNALMKQLKTQVADLYASLFECGADSESEDVLGLITVCSRLLRQLCAAVNLTQQELPDGL